MKVSKKYVRQIAFNLKDNTELKTTALVTDNVIAYGYLGIQDINKSESLDTGYFAKVFKLEGNNITLNGKELGINTDNFFDDVHAYLQESIKHLSFNEGVKFLRTLSV